MNLRWSDIVFVLWFAIFAGSCGDEATCPEPEDIPLLAGTYVGAGTMPQGPSDSIELDVDLAGDTVQARYTLQNGDEVVENYRIVVVGDMF